MDARHKTIFSVYSRVIATNIPKDTQNLYVSIIIVTVHCAATFGFIYLSIYY
jgi:hypothetical protein